MAASSRSSARSPPGRSPNGLRVSERRIPIGTVGANFEARPNVALDVAGQLLKSLNTAVLRTGGAALGTVTVLVDEVLRPALESAGLPAGAVGLVRSADREGARLLVTMPKPIPLVILRGSGRRRPRLRGSLPRTACGRSPTRRAAASSTSTRGADARGRSRSPRRASTASASATGSTSRSSTVTRGAAARACSRLRAGRRRGARHRVRRAASTARATRRAARLRVGERSRARRDRHARPRRRRSTRRSGSRTRRRPGSPPASSPRTQAAAERFLDGYRGTAAFWHATTRFADGFELTGAPETGINVDCVRARAGPVTYRDLWLRQYRVVGDGTQHR